MFTRIQAVPISLQREPFSHEKSNLACEKTRSVRTKKSGDSEL